MSNFFSSASKRHLFASILMTAAFTAIIPSTAQAAAEVEPTELWSCSGYCFMGGDTATNPWIPVSATGSDEEEARDNIDCGDFVEVGITCRRIRDNHDQPANIAG